MPGGLAPKPAVWGLRSGSQVGAPYFFTHCEEVNMFKHQSIKRWLAGCLVIAGASFPPAAQAIVIGGGGSIAVSPPVTGPVVQQQLGQLQRNVQQRFAAEGGWHLSARSTPAAATSSEGFHWGDAGIGAAGATVLLGAGALGATLARRRRPVLG
jgi:hypothetical protein